MWVLPQIMMSRHVSKCRPALMVAVHPVAREEKFHCC
jgi:hypothetical protein